jgi:hypothetical protein
VQTTAWRLVPVAVSRQAGANSTGESSAVDTYIGGFSTNAGSQSRRIVSLQSACRKQHGGVDTMAKQTKQQIIRFDDKKAAEAEFARVQSFAANARLRELP